MFNKIKEFFNGKKPDKVELYCKCDIEFNIVKTIFANRHIDVNYKAIVDNNEKFTLENSFRLETYDNDEEVYKGFLNMLVDGGEEFNKLREMLKKDIESQLLFKINELRLQELKDIYNKGGKKLRLDFNIEVDKEHYNTHK